MKIPAAIKTALKNQATYILFFLLLASTFTTRAMMDDFDSCGSSPERDFEVQYCLVNQQGDARFQKFDLTDTPTSLLHFIETPWITDQNNDFGYFPGLPAISWTRDTYVLRGTALTVVNVLQPIFFVLDVAYLFGVSVFVVSQWKTWTRKTKTIVSILLAYLYLPIIVILIGAWLALSAASAIASLLP